MQRTANTTQLVTLLASLFQARPRARVVAPEAFTLRAAGYGVIGNYPTVEAAQSALHYLPYSVRQQAEICDADGVCLCR